MSAQPKSIERSPEPGFAQAQQDSGMRYRRIAEAAYYRAEHRGFEPGHEEEDWLEAEKEIGEHPEVSPLKTRSR